MTTSDADAARRAATTGVAAAPAATALAAPLVSAALGPGAGGIGDPYLPGIRKWGTTST